MKIAVCGKGGVGKTFIAAGLAAYFAAAGRPVLAIDADSSPNLALSLGLSADEAARILPVAENEELIRMKTGTDFSGVFRLSFTVDDIIARYAVPTPSGANLLVMGTVKAMGAGLRLSRPFGDQGPPAPSGCRAGRDRHPRHGGRDRTSRPGHGRARRRPAGRGGCEPEIARNRSHDLPSRAGIGRSAPSGSWRTGLPMQSRMRCSVPMPGSTACRSSVRSRSTRKSYGPG